MRWNNALQHTERCFPLDLPSSLEEDLKSAPGSSESLTSLTCAGSYDHGLYGHAQLAATVKLSSHWQAGALVDANVTPGRDK